MTPRIHTIPGDDRGWPGATKLHLVGTRWLSVSGTGPDRVKMLRDEKELRG